MRYKARTDIKRHKKPFWGDAYFGSILGEIVTTDNIFTPDKLVMLCIQPRLSIGPIRLGMSRAEVDGTLNQMGLSVKRHATRDVWGLGKWVITYQKQTVVSMCLHKDPVNPLLEPLLFGFNPFTQASHQALMRMSRHGHYDEADPALGQSYVYPQLGLYFWRDSTPELIEQQGHTSGLALHSQVGQAALYRDWYQQARHDYQFFHTLGLFAPGHLD